MGEPFLIMAHNKSWYGNERLYMQSTFLEGMIITQPAPEHIEYDERVPEVTTIPVPQAIEISQQQLSWGAASIIVLCFLVFLGGYHLGRQTEGSAVLPAVELISNESADVLKDNTRIENFAVYKDALMYGAVMQKKGKDVSIHKRISCSASGVERCWYQVLYKDKHDLK